MNTARLRFLRVKQAVREMPAAGLSPEILALCASALLALAYNIVFWRTVLSGRDPWSMATWSFTTGTFVLLTMIHFVPLMLLGFRGVLRPLLTVVFLVAGVTQYFMLQYGTVFDADMMRNVLHTNPGEAREFLGWGLALWLAVFCALPLLLLWRSRLKTPPWKQTLTRRLSGTAAGLAAAVLAGGWVYQDLSSVLRNHREMRHAVSPLGPLLSVGRALWRDTQQAGLARAASEPAWRIQRIAAQRRPLLLILVVGETARAANFSLLGYPRPTNPELARENLIAYRDMHACGTATEVSLPCMFSPYGRADYDEDKIRSNDSALHVLANAGLDVTWVDNQSGCKTVCTGLPYVEAQRTASAGQCADGECLDEVLLTAIDRVPLDSTRDRVIVLHQLGNHGPAYHRRYPAAYARFQPDCRSDELRDCTRAQIVNAYDNAILYTDHVLAQVLSRLRARQGVNDVAMLYVSDHGESLGEHGLYLHGVPYAIAPEVQTRVPMLLWLPEPTAHALALDGDCLRRQAGARVSHDNVYHSLMGLLDVHVATYRKERDLFATCRAPAKPLSADRGSAIGAAENQSGRDM